MPDTLADAIAAWYRQTDPGLAGDLPTVPPDNVAAVNRRSAAAGWTPDASFERSIRRREADPAAFSAWLATDSSGYAFELALYEAGREGAVNVGAFDPAKYQEEAS